MVVTIHQPEHMPWLGLFHKINRADVFVILDNVQFRKNYFQNRNKIRTANGWTWITVPVKYSFGQHIREVMIDNAKEKWKKKYWDSIYYAYKKAPFYDTCAGAVQSIIEQEWRSLAELNTTLIVKISELLGIKARIVRATDMEAQGKAGLLLLRICRELGADTYLSGISGKEYLDIKDFQRAGIEVVFQEFHHPVYRQLHEPFAPCMSVIDLLFNYGTKSLDVINGRNVPVLDTVFL